MQEQFWKISCSARKELGKRHVETHLNYAFETLNTLFCKFINIV